MELSDLGSCPVVSFRINGIVSCTINVDKLVPTSVVRQAAASSKRQLLKSQSLVSSLSYCHVPMPKARGPVSTEDFNTKL
jgi:hypothetical protein